MLTVMGAIAWVVYRKWGLDFLRRKWINFDLTVQILLDEDYPDGKTCISCPVKSVLNWVTCETADFRTGCAQGELYFNGLFL